MRARPSRRACAFWAWSALSVRLLGRLSSARVSAPLTALVAVGGGGRSDGFAEACSSSKTRQRFATGLAKYVKRGKLDGADLDWEAPATPQQAADYAECLKATRAACELDDAKRSEKTEEAVAA